MIVGIIFILLASSSFIYTSYRLDISKAIFHPFTFISIYFSIFFIFPIMVGEFFIPAQLQDVYDKIKRHIDLLSYIVIVTYFILFIINTIQIKSICNNNFQSNKKTIVRRVYNLPLTLLILGYAGFLFLILLLLVAKSGGVGAFLSDPAGFAIAARNGNALLLLVLYTSELLPIIYFLTAKKRSNTILFGLISLAAFIVIVLGARTIVVSLIISVMLLFFSKKRVNFTRILISGICVVVLFLSSSLVRSNAADTGGVDKLVSYLANNVDQLTSTLLVMQKLDSGEINIQYGLTIIDAAYFFIPTAIWKDKPRSYLPSRVVYPDLIEQGVSQNVRHTFNFGMVGRPILDFGFLGVITLNVVLFLLLSKLYYSIIYYSNNISKLRLALYVYIYSHIHQIYILGVWSHVVSIVFFNFAVLFLLFSIVIFLGKGLKKENANF